MFSKHNNGGKHWPDESIKIYLQYSLFHQEKKYFALSAVSKQPKIVFLHFYLLINFQSRFLHIIHDNSKIYTVKISQSTIRMMSLYIDLTICVIDQVYTHDSLLHKKKYTISKISKNFFLHFKNLLILINGTTQLIGDIKYWPNCKRVNSYNC